MASSHRRAGLKGFSGPRRKAMEYPSGDDLKPPSQQSQGVLGTKKAMKKSSGDVGAFACKKLSREHTADRNPLQSTITLVTPMVGA